MTQHLYILTGASRGMGLAMAEQLLRAGHALVGISRKPNPALQTLATASGAVFEEWHHDLAQSVPVAAKLGQWLSHQGSTRWASVTLINNAGTLAQLAPLSGADAGDLAHALRVGLEAPMQLTAAFLHATKEWTGARKVLNISSGLGRRAMASQAAYCAAKAGMDHFTRCVALDEALAPNGAKVCALAPGVIDTDMQQQLRAGDFPDREDFSNLKHKGQLTSPQDAATKVLGYLARADFGVNPVADVRDA